MKSSLAVPQTGTWGEPQKFDFKCSKQRSPKIFRIRFTQVGAMFILMGCSDLQNSKAKLKGCIMGRGRAARINATEKMEHLTVFGAGTPYSFSQTVLRSLVQL